MSSEPEDQRHESASWDRLLTKYVAVWLWSIIFGTSAGTGATFAYLTLGPGKWGPLTPVLVACGVLGVLFVAAAWLQLYFFLSRQLIPQLYGEARPPDPAAGLFLLRAFLYTFAATLIGLILVLVKFSFQTLQ